MNTPISMKDLSMDQRRNILFDLQVMKNREVREKYNITARTIGHIRYYHGKSNAVGKGDYHKDLLEGRESPIVEKIKLLKKEGKNSLEVSQELNLPLLTINNNWA